MSACLHVCVFVCARIFQSFAVELKKHEDGVAQPSLEMPLFSRLHSMRSTIYPICQARYSIFPTIFEKSVVTQHDCRICRLIPLNTYKRTLHSHFIKLNFVKNLLKKSWTTRSQPQWGVCARCNRVIVRNRLHLRGRNMRKMRCFCFEFCGWNCNATCDRLMRSNSLRRSMH